MLLITLLSIAGLGLAFGLWFWWACAVPNSTFFKPALTRGPEEGKRICLTFDDGPATPFTEQILAILRKYQVPATFFLCGRNVEREPDLARHILAEGHAVGNHTYSHRFLGFKSRRRMAREIDRTQDVIEKVVGHRPVVFRPPFGVRWFGLEPTLRERGIHLVLWSATGYDWKKDVPGIVAATMKELKPGAVILLHDGRETRSTGRVDRSRTVRALPGIIEGARQRGYTFVPLQEFLSAR
jgi:peptidoglycan/xylan/chitin deacetylase (PgdA/CDA1 family)